MNFFILPLLLVQITGVVILYWSTVCLKYDIILTFTYFVAATFIATHTLQHKSNIFI